MFSSFRLILCAITWSLRAFSHRAFVPSFGSISCRSSEPCRPVAGLLFVSSFGSISGRSSEPCRPVAGIPFARSRSCARSPEAFRPVLAGRSFLQSVRSGADRLNRGDRSSGFLSMFSSILCADRLKQYGLTRLTLNPELVACDPVQSPVCISTAGDTPAITFIGAQNLIEIRWLTDDGLQRLTQSRLETSSSSTDDVDDSGSVEMGALGPTKAHCTMNCREFSCGCEE